MYNNIGTKIKTWAKVGCWISIIVFIILGLILVDDGNEFGIVVMIVGGLGSWVSSWITYGFGEIIDLLQESVNRQNQILAEIYVQNKTEDSNATVLMDIESNLPEM